MNTLFESIMETTEPKGWLTQSIRKKIFRNLLIDDKERIKDINAYCWGNFPTSEDIEKLFWGNDNYKDKVDDYYGYVTEWLEYANLTPDDVVKAYSLARSGKQSKIEVIATVINALILL